MTNQPTICCLFPWMELGGADKFNLDLVRALAAHGWRVSIITTLPAQHAWRAAFAACCADIVDVGMLPAGAQPAALIHAVAERQPDLVLVSHSGLGYAALPLLRVQLPRAALVDYCHIVESDQPGYPALSAAQRRFLDLHIVSSHNLRAWLLAHGAEPARVHVCSTNIDPALWDATRYDRAQIRQQHGIPPDAPLILYAGRLERQKQPLLALQVLRRVIAAAPETHALVVGAGKFGTNMRRSIARWGLGGRIRMLGALPNEQVRALLAASDILFLPSEMEGISLAIYEAMAMGVVPASGAVGGQAELVTPECGVLVPRGPHEQADYTAALLRLIRSPEAMRATGQRARARIVEHFPLDAMGVCMLGAIAQARRNAAAHAPVSAADVAVALAEARRVAQQDADTHRAAAHTSAGTQARGMYWRVFGEWAWWLLPAAEAARRALRKLRA